MKVRNKFEAKIKGQLKRRKIEFDYEPVSIPYIRKHNYWPDFVLTIGDHTIYVECKGFFRREDKAKIKAVKTQHPELDIRIVFYAKRSADIRWCEKNGIAWSIGKIPKEWLI